MPQTSPDFPAGPFVPTEVFAEETKSAHMASLQMAPRRLCEAVAGLTDSQLDTKYKNWSVRQIVHHVADSHVHSYIRFRWALTESNPTIKAYNEADWVLITDSAHGDVAPPLALLEGLHSKWVQMLASMVPEQFERTFIHPELNETVRLWTALCYYPWHCRHHTGQILWMREHNGWAAPTLS